MRHRFFSPQTSLWTIAYLAFGVAFFSASQDIVLDAYRREILSDHELAYAFAPEKLQGWKWLASVVLVFGILIVPKVTVGVVDKTGGSAVKVVDNVPPRRGAAG